MAGTTQPSSFLRDNQGMTRDDVIAKLRENEAALREQGVVRLSVFGSTARGDRRPDSGVDLLAKFDDSKRLSLLKVIGIELRLSEMLGQRVDLMEEGTLKPRVQSSAERDQVLAF